MENKKYNMVRVNLANVNIPVMTESFNRTPWVNYGNDNQYPEYLIHQYNNCAIHKAVVNAKRELTCGDGLVCPTDPLVVVMPVNGKENIEEVFRKAALDYIMFGGYALNVIWSRDRKSIAEIYHIDFSRLRSGKLNEKDEITEYFYSPDWTNTRKYTPVKYPVFDQNTSDPSQIVYHYDYSPNNSYYPIPDYSGGLAAINIDIQIKNFHNNNLINGFNPSLFINFNNGIPSEDEKQEITSALEYQYAGSTNAGKPIVSFNESKELSPEITQIGTNASDNYYTTLYDDITRSILSSHRVSSAELFGIATQGKLGGGDEIIQHSEYFRNTVIIPYIKQLLPTFNKLMSLKYEKPIRMEVKPLSILNLEDKTATNVN
jgi:hypothetical protein